MDHISICICTLNRNQMLERLLRSVAVQETEGNFEISVVVVDNDVTGGARETVLRLSAELGLSITYGIEPEKMIPAARNHALKLSRGNYIGIIDDDEFAPRNWLITMYKAIHLFKVDGVLGPVFPFFEEEPPTWLVKSRFCERPVHRTGTLLNWNQTRTGNVLLKKEVFERHKLFFDINCKTSGSDKEFFREAINRGCHFIAVAEAPVYEIVPSERQAKWYYLRRAIVHASNERKFRAPLLRGFDKVVAPLKAFVALIVYIMIMPFSAITGIHSVMIIGEKIAYHLSWLLAMAGINLAKKRDF